jgi:hypothetical protein
MAEWMDGWLEGWKDGWMARAREIGGCVPKIVYQMINGGV